jgi:hypothetical protein
MEYLTEKFMEEDAEPAGLGVMDSGFEAAERAGDEAAAVVEMTAGMG